MTPSAWINGGAGVTIDWAVVESALGPMLLAATDEDGKAILLQPAKRVVSGAEVR
jgi:hypothetical protein